MTGHTQLPLTRLVCQKHPPPSEVVSNTIRAATSSLRRYGSDAISLESNQASEDVALYFVAMFYALIFHLSKLLWSVLMRQ